MKRNAIRKIVLLSLSLCMAAMLAGCGNTASENSTAGKPANSKSSDSKSSEAEKEVEHSVEAQEFNENIIGTADGYGYELWKDNGDTKFFVEPGGGCFSCEWKNINNALFRRGQKFNCTQTYDQLGNISVDYGIDYKPQGNSYMCVYGWTKSPLVEFYIVESWGTWRPPGAPFAIGDVTVDGAVYDIYKTTRVEQPSIDGTQTFDQYWSVRREKPSGEGTKREGTISVSKHFDAWKKCGLELGKMYEVALTIEGYQSNGSAVIYRNDLKIDGTYSEATDIEVNVDEGAIKKLENGGQ